jgi:hypothetical protein
MANKTTDVIVSGDLQGAVISLKMLSKHLDEGAKASSMFGLSLGKVSSLLATFVSTSALADLASFVKGTFDAADTIGQLSTRIGASTEALSEYRHVAELTGIKFEQLVKGWQLQTQHIAEAARGTGKAKKALEELGLEAETLAKQRPEEQFETIAKAMEGVSSQTDRVRIGTQLWGSDVYALLQTMEGGTGALTEMRGEAQRLGRSLGEDQVQAAEAANSAIVRMKAAAQGLTEQLALKLAPGVAQVIEKFNELLQTEGLFPALGGAINKAFSTIIYGATPELSAVDKQILQYEEKIRNMQPAIENITGIMENMRNEGIKEDSLAWEVHQAQLDKYNQIVDDANNKVDLLKTSLGQSTKATVDNTTAEKENNKAKNEKNETLDELIFSIDKEAKATHDFMQTYDRLTEEVLEGNLSFERYNELVDMLATGQANAEKATESLTDALAGSSSEANAFSEVWEKAAGRIKETFTSALNGSFDSFSDFKDSLVEGFKTTLAELAQAALARPILVSLGIGSSGTANAPSLSSVDLSSLFSGDGLSSLLSGSGLSSLFGGNSFGMSLMNLGDSFSPGLLQNAGLYSNMSYGIAGALGGLAGDAIFGGYGGTGGSLGATVGMAFGGPVGAVIGGLAGGALGGLFGGDDEAKATYVTTQNSNPAFFEDDLYVESAFGNLGLKEWGSKNIKAKKFKEALEAIAAIDDTIAQAFGEEATAAVAQALDGWESKDNNADDFDERMAKRLRTIIDELDFQFGELATLGADSVEEISTRLFTLKGISDLLESDPLADAELALANANATLKDSFDASADSVLALGDAYDGTTEATTEIASAIQSRYALELEYLAQIATIQDSVTSSLESSIQNIKLSVMDTEQQYEYYSDQAEALAESLATLSDPEAIHDAVAEINTLTSQAYALLSDDQKTEASNEFIEFLESVNSQAIENLDAEKDRVATESEQLREALLSAIQQGGEQFAEKLELVAQQQQAAADVIWGSAEWFAQTTSQPITVDVTYSSVGEVG